MVRFDVVTYTSVVTTPISWLQFLGSIIMRLLTWNLAMLERSAAAPQAWQQFHTEAAIRDFVLDIGPDVVCYQELPNQVPFVETLDLLRATTRTHNGNLATLVTHEIAATEPAVTVVDGIAVLATFDDELTIANVHLAPGPGVADHRVEQISKVVAASPTHNLLIIGDTNTRLEEAALLLDNGFSGVKPPAATWDSRANRFRFGGPEFTAYFTRWFASPGLVVSNVVVHREPAEFQGARFHLSDHYALSLELGPSS